MTEDLQVIGPNLTLRYATANDAAGLYEIGSNDEVTQFFSWGPYTNLDQPLAYIRSLEQKRATGEMLEFLVVHREYGPIGVTGVCELSRRDRRATVGTWFGREWWGTGANFESKALVAALGFEHLGLARLTAWANTTNTRSQKALEKVGFTREGVLRSWHKHGDVMHDVVAFGMLREEWEKSTLREVPASIKGRAPDTFIVGTGEVAKKVEPAPVT
jgi:ribosomal-protein-alanine N-acetyltransferase